MKILVTGSAGFIGFHTSTQLLDVTVGDGESISLTVDGELVDDPRNHILVNGQELVLTLS